jgi:hypothetical protein
MPMASIPFLYRCPNTGLEVQGFVADDAAKAGGLQPVTCLACTRLHLVDPKTAKIADSRRR